MYNTKLLEITPENASIVLDELETELNARIGTMYHVTTGEAPKSALDKFQALVVTSGYDHNITLASSDNERLEGLLLVGRKFGIAGDSSVLTPPKLPTNLEVKNV